MKGMNRTGNLGGKMLKGERKNGLNAVGGVSARKAGQHYK